MHRVVTAALLVPAKLGNLLHVCSAGTIESHEVRTEGTQQPSKGTTSYFYTKMEQCLRIVEGTDQ